MGARAGRFRTWHDFLPGDDVGCGVRCLRKKQSSVADGDKSIESRDVGSCTSWASPLHPLFNVASKDEASAARKTLFFFRRPRTQSAQPRATLKWGFEGALRVGDGYLLGAHQTRVVFLKRCFFRRHRNKTLVDYFCCKLAGSLRLSSRLIGHHVTPYAPCSSLPSQSVYLYIYAHIYSPTHACMCVIYV